MKPFLIVLIGGLSCTSVVYADSTVCSDVATGTVLSSIQDVTVVQDGVKRVVTQPVEVQQAHYQDGTVRCERIAEMPFQSGKIAKIIDHQVVFTDDPATVKRKQDHAAAITALKEKAGLTDDQLAALGFLP